jgi:hypothetical protein
MRQYQVILVDATYNIVIAVTPPNSNPNTPGVKCYRRQDWDDGMHKAHEFFEIEPSHAQLSYTGQPDHGAGAARLPGRTFDSLAEIDGWVEERQNEVKKS